jgi:hypothetical protein
MGGVVMDSTLLPRNEGTVDRTLRVIVGIALIAVVFIGPQTPWGWVGVIPLVTGLVGSCPVYRLLGMNTCPLGKSEHEATG